MSPQTIKCLAQTSSDRKRRMRGILAPAGPKPATQTDHPLVDSLYGVVALDAEIQLYDSMLPADRGGQHMGPRLGWSMIPDHQILLWRFERMQSNANWFAGQIDAMGIADVRRATFDGGSTFLYLSLIHI